VVRFPCLMSILRCAVDNRSFQSEFLYIALFFSKIRQNKSNSNCHRNILFPPHLLPCMYVHEPNQPTAPPPKPPSHPLSHLPPVPNTLPIHPLHSSTHTTTHTIPISSNLHHASHRKQSASETKAGPGSRVRVSEMVRSARRWESRRALWRSIVWASSSVSSVVCCTGFGGGFFLGA